ncbi:structural protein [Mycobacterium phage JHC117]|uniref:Structural protein n=1 Tax=Mycobacterium phage JHC117 TaxID=2920885 RepID=G1BMP1_9CAUD|nr:minor tail protein [Mycobacterium phage JHC117]AEJ95105.1 structural protein [Mycobacterium phage JHC117]
MAIRYGNVNPNAFRVGTQTPSRIFLGNDQVWPEFTSATQQYTTAGAFTYDIPANCLYLDIIVLGSGACGKGMQFIDLWGPGGGAGQWNSVTLRRGVDIPWSVLTVTGTVGQGRPSNGQGASLAGNPTTATITGYGSITGAGGVAGSSAGGGLEGKSPGNHVRNGITYVGGAAQGNIGGAGNPPGGGGASHTTTFGSGGAGANGSVWVRAYI